MDPFSHGFAAFIARERHQELLAEAAERRMARLAGASRFRRSRRRHPRWD